jgi:NAD(P)-dependent dehydrogenase (short-subunit alcohol dehydrogenase family)
MVSATHQQRRHWAWISGGVGGLGLAFASALLENGAAGVALVDCDASAGAEALAKLAGINTSSVVRFETCDVTDVHAVRKSMADCRAAFGGYLNLVVNNAG